MAPMLPASCDKPLKGGAAPTKRAGRDEIRRRCLRTGAGYSERGEGSQRSAMVRAVIAVGILVLFLPQGAAAQKRAAPADASGAGRVFRDCPTCPEMVAVPAGEFMMGSPESERGRNKDEGPQHKVTISKPFAVGKFEVTFAQWDACVAESCCTH